MYELITAVVTGFFSLVMVWMTYRLNQIHTLVNSNMTVALQAVLLAQVAGRLSLVELIAVKRAAGEEPSAEILATLAELDAKIVDSRAALVPRLKGT
jgi:hypothetical protein